MGFSSQYRRNRKVKGLHVGFVIYVTLTEERLTYDTNRTFLLLL
jgi:hypothetical protein